MHIDTKAFSQIFRLSSRLWDTWTRRAPVSSPSCRARKRMPSVWLKTRCMVGRNLSTIRTLHWVFLLHSTNLMIYNRTSDYGSPSGRSTGQDDNSKRAPDARGSEMNEWWVSDQRKQEFVGPFLKFVSYFRWLGCQIGREFVRWRIRRPEEQAPIQVRYRQLSRWWGIPDI